MDLPLNNSQTSPEVDGISSISARARSAYKCQHVECVTIIPSHVSLGNGHGCEACGKAVIRLHVSPLQGAGLVLCLYLLQALLTGENATGQTCRNGMSVVLLQRSA